MSLGMHVFNGILNRNDVVSRLLVEQANERCERARLAVARWTGEDYEAFLVLRDCRKRLEVPRMQGLGLRFR